VDRGKLLQEEDGRPLGNRLLSWTRDSLAIQAIVSFVCFVVFVVDVGKQFLPAQTFGVRHREDKAQGAIFLSFHFFVIPRCSIVTKQTGGSGGSPAVCSRIHIGCASHRLVYERFSSISNPHGIRL
jgi:hypothetical protein